MDSQATVTTFREPAFGDFMENVEFDGRGTMWVANLVRNRLERYAPDGTVQATVPLRAPGAMRIGPDGLLYANSGDGILDDNLLPLRRAGVFRIDPAAAKPTPTPYATGLRVANGAAFDGGGNLYVANSGLWGRGLVKIRPGGQVDRDWGNAIGFTQANGVAVIGDSLYTTLTYNLRSPVVRVPLDQPAQSRTVVEYSAASVPKFLDDINAGPNGSLLVAAHVTGELIRLDPETRKSCVLASGLSRLTSARTAHDFGPYEGDIFATEGNGSIKRIHLTPRGPK